MRQPGPAVSGPKPNEYIIYDRKRNSGQGC